MSFIVKKENGILLFRDLGGFQTRNISTILCIKEANKIYFWNDFTEIVIDTNDNYSGHGHSYINLIYGKLVPDFVFHSWPEVGIHDYTEFVKEIEIAGRLYSPTVNKVGWIGNSNTNIRRKEMLTIGSNNTDLFEFFDMSWKYSGTTVLDSTKYIYTPDLVKKYSMVIDIEGNGPYSARLKTLLWSHRPLLLVDRPGKEYFFEYLKEWEHYIPVKRDLSDLVEKTKWIIDNYKAALQIAENAYEFSKTYLTREASYKQWDRIIRAAKEF
jgi:hypothetical protein